jgi:DNA-binding NarL/FixJ family response regulator
MRVVAEASDGDEALGLFRKHRPDVTLMDIRMPKVNGIAAISSIRQEFPHARIVVLTTSAGDVQILRAFKAGAVGYLLKNLLRTELVETIRLFTAVINVFPRRSPNSLQNMRRMIRLRLVNSTCSVVWQTVIPTKLSLPI